MTNHLIKIISLIIVLTFLSGCTINNGSENNPSVEVNGEFTLTNGYRDGVYLEGIKLLITSLDPEDVVLDIKEVKVEVLNENGDLASTWYQGKISQIDFYKQVDFSSIYDCVGDKDTLDKGDWITFWFKENSNDFESTLDGYTISLHWKGQEIFSKKVDYDDLKFENIENIEKVLVLSISTNNTSVQGSSETKVPLNVILTNKGNVTYLIDEPTLIHQTLKVEIATPDNKKINYMLAVLELPRSIKIYSNDPIKLFFEIGGEYWDDKDLTYGSTGFYFDVKGDYSITATYISGHADDEQTESCEIVSNQITLKIE